MAKTYTYVQFAKDVIAIMTGECSDPDPKVCDAIVAKANDLIVQQLKKAEYAKEHPSKSKAKGASEKTRALAEQIKGVLNSEPMTASEISQALNTDLTALQVSNAVKYIEGATSAKVIREFVGKNGLRSEKLYTGYAIA